MNKKGALELNVMRCQVRFVIFTVVIHRDAGNFRRFYEAYIKLALLHCKDVIISESCIAYLKLAHGDVIQVALLD